MTKEETKKFIEAFKSDYAKFIENCKRVAEKLSRYDNDEYGFCDIFYLDHNDVCAEGDEYWNFGGHEHHYCEFPIDLLTYTDEELDAYVDNLIRKKNEEKEQERKKQEEKTRNKELETLKRLKEKYENQ